jgi:hypothetical protein
MQVGHAPIVEEFAASDRVAKVNHPVVAGVSVSQRRSHASLGHHGMGLSQQTLAQNTHTETAISAFDRRP